MSDEESAELCMESECEDEEEVCVFVCMPRRTCACVCVYDKEEDVCAV